jgi:hypothetical protein
MERTRAHCSRCQSADSIEHGICQVCLAEQPTRAVRIGTLLARRSIRIDRTADTPLVLSSNDA